MTKTDAANSSTVSNSSPAATVRAALALYAELVSGKQRGMIEPARLTVWGSSQVTAVDWSQIRALLAEHEADMERAFREGRIDGINSVDKYGDTLDTDDEAVAAWRERRAAEKGTR